MVPAGVVQHLLVILEGEDVLVSVQMLGVGEVHGAHGVYLEALGGGTEEVVPYHEGVLDLEVVVLERGDDPQVVLVPEGDVLVSTGDDHVPLLVHLDALDLLVEIGQVEQQFPIFHREYLESLGTAD